MKSLLVAALLAFGLAGCGGGGGGDAIVTGGGDSTIAIGTTPAPGTTTTSITTDTGAGTGSGGSTPAQPRFFAAWTAAMQDFTASLPGTTPPAAPTFDNQTIRQIVRLSLGGDTLRVKLSNRFGKSAAVFSQVRVARSSGGSGIEAGSDRAVTFGGQPALSLAPGAEAISDPVALPMAALSPLAISIFFAGPTVMPTVHLSARQTAYVAAGNQVSAASVTASGADLRDSYFAITAVETSSAQPAKVAVAFGDSMTDGFGSALDANRRYPDLLDNRLKAAQQLRTGVVNAGIGGNRWLHDFAGPSGSSRFDRDVLGVAGVSHTIILLGINDIGFSVSTTPLQGVSAQQIIDAIATAVAQARPAGVKVLLATLLPFRGADDFSVDGEAKRQAVNGWIRGQAEAALVDFDLVMRSAADPARLNPLFDSGDHLHPNDAGYAAMADAIDLALLQ